MKVWIDNTGLHSAGRCLVREATIDEDVDGLLQFATLLVFAEKISFADYSSERIAAESGRFQAALKSEGVGRGTLVKSRLDETGYQKACSATAEAAADDWPHQLDGEADEPPDAAFDAPTHADRPMGWAVALAAGGPIPALPGIGEGGTLQKKGGYAVEYMLAMSPALRESVDRTRSERGWGAIETEKLESLLRASLNDRLARDRGASYVPAVSRARQLARENSKLIGQLDRELGDMVRRLQPTAPPVPSVIANLMDRGRRHPAGIIEEALKMRSKAGWLRNYLSERLARLDGDAFDSPAFDSKEEEEFRRYAADILQLKTAPPLARAFDFELKWGFIPNLRAHGGPWEESDFHQRMKRRLSVLTDIVRHSPPVTERDMQTLRSNSMKASE